MQYRKKICILKQLSAGFAADGKVLSALLTAETFGGRLTATLTPIGLAPLSAGRYRAVLCDAHGTAEAFDLPSPAGFTAKRQSALDLADGLGCLLAYVNGAAKAVAAGSSGEHAYDWKQLCAQLDESAPPQKEARQNESAPEKKTSGRGGAPQNAEEGRPAANGGAEKPPYDDEAVADENYFAFADADRQKEEDDAQTNSPAEEAGYGRNAGTDEDAQSLFLRTGSEENGADEGACYYDQVKKELDGLFERYPAEEELARSIPCSRWAKINFSAQKYYVVGVIGEEARVKYICYGVPAERREAPPEALKKWCSYLPLSVFDLNGKGYWMMFQDAVNGACIKLEQA